MVRTRKLLPTQRRKSPPSAGTELPDLDARFAAAVEQLKRLTHLRMLDVRETGVSEAGGKQLAAALPDCKILH